MFFLQTNILQDLTVKQKKRNPHAKTFSRFKTTIQVTERHFYNSVFLGKASCLSPPWKCKSVLKTSPAQSCQILSNAEESERALHTFVSLATHNFACRTNPWFLIFPTSIDVREKYTAAFQVRSSKQWALACSTRQSTAETMGV